MTRFPIYQVDAFTSQRFAGNPAAVIPLDSWLPDATMQAIARENNLAETAFLVPRREGEADYGLRWFTPTTEVDLCGHATLASAFALRACMGVTADRVVFDSRSGLLAVDCDGAFYTLDFPANVPVPRADTRAVVDALDAAPTAVLKGGAFTLAVFANEDNVAGLSPDMAAISAITDTIGIIATAPGQDLDFVSRFFAPGAGIPEDPVTGSAHTVLTPYWARELGRTELWARQISARGGDLQCRLVGDRVRIGGQCVLYLEGRILI